MQVLRKHLSGSQQQQSSAANGNASNGAAAPQHEEQTSDPSQQARAAAAAAAGGDDWLSQARQGQSLRDYIAAEASKLEAVTREGKLPQCSCFDTCDAARQGNSATQESL